MAISKEKLLLTGIFEDNNYLDLYINLINDNMSLQYIEGKTQLHHIIPKYYFYDNDLQVDNTNDNVVNLMYSDHIKAHYYLCGCCRHKKDVSRNALSIRFILNGKSLSDFNIQDVDFYDLQEKYELGRQQKEWINRSDNFWKSIQKSLNGRISPNKGNRTSTVVKQYSQLGLKRLGQGNPFYGKKHSQELKDKISQLNGKPVQMIDRQSKQVIMTFNSAKKALIYLIENGYTANKTGNTQILKVCRKNDLDYHAYGFCWLFAEKV